MAKRAEKHEETEFRVEEVRIPRPVPGGTEHLESLGRWVDNLMGDARRRRKARRELEPLYLKEEEMPDDPPPSEPPPPVPDDPEKIIKERKPNED